MKFKLISGRWTKEDGTKCNAGSVIDSDKDLAKIFPNSFEAMKDDKKSTVPQTSANVAGAPAKPQRTKGVKGSGQPVSTPPAVAQESTQTPASPAPAGLKAVHKGGGRWDVIDANGSRINDKYLTKEEAKAMVGK